LEHFPPIDLILLTHAHADHLSFPSLHAFEGVPVYAPPAVARWIRRRGIRQAVELGPGESVISDDVTVWAGEAVHAGNRYGVDRWRRQSNMYLVATNSESVIFAGDTAINPDVTNLVKERLGMADRQLDVALLPIGYAPWWKVGFRRGHLTSWDALTLFEQLNARYFIPYHWGTFHHVTATAYSAISELRRHIVTHTRGSDVRVLEPGEAFDSYRNTVSRTALEL
jgi:L-ascorbate metabolism protein UlaG (beta-lactamase superfamily)